MNRKRALPTGAARFARTIRSAGAARFAKATRFTPRRSPAQEQHVLGLQFICKLLRSPEPAVCEDNGDAIFGE